MQALQLIETRPQSALARATEADHAYQVEILPGVSRTFALTIPELPEGLAEVVTNGYLLCRIADTIEDDPALDAEDRRRFHALFAATVAAQADAEELASELAPLLSTHTLAAERELVRNTARVVRVTHSFPSRQRAALAHCVEVMCGGMPRFREGRAGLGLRDVAELHEYCYYVAGCVGEMLTELFCAHSPAIDAQRTELAARAVSFGQGLQMTNILKDVWDDLDRGYCWLPREHFACFGLELARLDEDRGSPAFGAGLGDLLGIAHGHLRDALDYTLLIPREEQGIRRFCLWALGMAVLTLQEIEHDRGFRTSRQVKISRRAVKAAILTSNLALREDGALRTLFALGAAGLPPAAWAASAK